MKYYKTNYQVPRKALATNLLWSAFLLAGSTVVCQAQTYQGFSEPRRISSQNGQVSSAPMPFQEVRFQSDRPSQVTSSHTSQMNTRHVAVYRSESNPGQADATNGKSPWWQSEVATPIRSGSTVNVDINGLLLSALNSSAQIRVFSDLPLIRETAITEADAAFDWVAFMESRWDDTNEPVGSTLTTGGPSRFVDQNFSYSAGARRRNTFGGQFEASQRFGHQNNNSVFFVPNDQGNARLTLSYTQPLLRGAGRVYNTSLTVLAQIDSKIARDEFSRQLQSHLLEVTRAYWSLYLERATLLQKRRLLLRAEVILNDLDKRQSLDTINSQVVRARAAVASRRAEILRAEMAVMNAESRIRALTNDPAWGESDAVELVPVDMPFRSFADVDMQSALSTAMQLRPEIGQAVKQCKASCIRMNMAKNEVLPVLNLIMESYASGLRGDSDISGAWADQFSEGRPSYSAGIQYEIPIWNRAAKARLQRRRLEVRQLQNQFRTTTETLKLEVAVAVRELATSFQEMGAKKNAMEAASAEVEYISERWKALGGEDRSASLMLEDLLNAQTRLAEAEFGFLNSGLTYNLAQMNYKKAVGTLLQDERVSVCRNCHCRLPGQSLSKEVGVANMCQCHQGHSQPTMVMQPGIESDAVNLGTAPTPAPRPVESRSEVIVPRPSVLQENALPKNSNEVGATPFGPMPPAATDSGGRIGRRQAGPAKQPVRTVRRFEDVPASSRTQQNSPVVKSVTPPGYGS